LTVLIAQRLPPTQTRTLRVRLLPNEVSQALVPLAFGENTQFQTSAGFEVCCR
jgi:hypothetical protein